MNDAEAAARGTRAKAAWEEFVAPQIAEMKRAYLARIADIATTELDPKIRSEKLTALSVALKIAGNVESGLEAAMRDGEVAEKRLIKAENIEKMGAGKRRLLNFAPQG